MRTRFRALAVLITVVLALGACSSDETGDDDADASDSDDNTTATTEPTAGPDAGPVDQTPPAGANGLTIDDEGRLWIAVINSNEVLQVDPDSGAILQRFPTPEGAGPDDLVLADDGTIYWTGFLGGQVGSIDPGSGESTTIAEIGAGANPIALRSDGTLIVGRAVTATGLFAVDPAGGSEPQALADPGNVNSFSLAPDGILYAPLADAAGGSVVAIDSATGSLLETVVDVPGVPAAVRVVGDQLYVLSMDGTAKVHRVSLADRTLELFADTGLALADNLAVTDSGTVYVSGLNQPVVVEIDPAGAVVETIEIGV